MMDQQNIVRKSTFGHQVTKIFWNLNFYIKNDLGCILVEMILGRPIFQAENDQEQMSEIFNIVGESDSNKKNSQGGGKEKKIKGKGWNQVKLRNMKFSEINF